jgi:hypothetical protein
MRHLYSFTDFLNEGKVEDIHAKYYSGMEASTFHQIVTADPTSITMNGETKKIGTYSKWLLKLFQDGKLLLEDLYKATEYLTLFDKLKAQKVITGTAADINRYGSLPDLFKYIKEFGGTGETGEDESYLLEDRYFINSGEAEVFHEDDDYLIVIPRTLNASQFYAHGTEWCTQFPDMFKEYSDKGDLYIIIDKHKLNTDEDNRRMQFHFQSMQYMDMMDEEIYADGRTIFLKYFQQVKEKWMLCYDDVNDTRGGRTIVMRDAKYGCVDLDGSEVIPCQYDLIGLFSEGKAVVQNDNKWGFIDLGGNEVTPLIYDWASEFKSDMAPIKWKGRWGFIDCEGNEVIPSKYDIVGNFIEGRARVMLNGKWGFVDLDGNEYWD